MNMASTRLMYVAFNDRGLVFNVNKRTKEQNVFFCEEVRNEYSIGYRVKVHALIDEVQVPLELVQSCYEIAQLNERLTQLKTSIKIPSVVPMGKAELEQKFTDALAIMSRGDYAFHLDKALEGFKSVLYYNPGHTESIYNCACIYSLQEKHEEALQWLQRTFDTGYTNVLRVITDSDFKSATRVATSSLEGFKRMVRKAYSQCIMAHFQVSYRNMINIARYNAIYKEEFKDAQLDELRKYDIDPRKPWDLSARDW